MAGFTMCAACAREYDDPADRRFHAEPNACQVCGPQVWLVGGDRLETGDAAVRDAAAALVRGAIVAVKGLASKYSSPELGHLNVSRNGDQVRLVLHHSKQLLGDVNESGRKEPTDPWHLRQRVLELAHPRRVAGLDPVR